MLKILEDKLLEMRFSRFGYDDYTDGVMETLKFCIRKHKEGWCKQQFEQHLQESIDENVTGDYEKGLIAGLKYNLKHMEVATNE